MYVTNSVSTEIGDAIVSDIPENCSDTQVGERDATHITSGHVGMSGSSLTKP
jgi:hypothetical protein